METRRDFLKKAALLSGAAVWVSVPESIVRALEIHPVKGSTFLDAEHVVILMQENRSFDHSYGTLNGVRGYRDPRAHRLANGRPVWLQTNHLGETYAPFRLNINETNVTWMGGLPHSWGNQVDARNDGRYDKWLDVKPSGYEGYADKPMTLGHYTRQDIPFYYALADAFTICDQHFCSSLTGTDPNRLYLWSGTIRAEQSPDSKPHVYNEEIEHENEVRWTTFPERLERLGISWKVYQNELAIPTGMTGEEELWLSNFGDNPLEYFSQFGVRFNTRYLDHLKSLVQSLPNEIQKLEDEDRRSPSKKLQERIKELRSSLDKAHERLGTWTKERFASLGSEQRSIHQRAFCTNETDPHFGAMESLAYEDGGHPRTMNVPKGDVLHQFRQDVTQGKLPTVSWLVAPEAFSDHPSSAWFGAWYVSEALDILTQNPEVWKKTIFILTYDENDGYFDHVPPFVAPNPYRPESGRVTDGIDAAVEFVTKEQDLKFRPNYEPRESPIGLGFRVPMVIASPWTRGGCVCSEVFDHTSVLQFLEHFLSHRTGKEVTEPNISSWRRAVCGNLTSAFQAAPQARTSGPTAVERNSFAEGIDRAKYLSPPTGFHALTPSEIEAIEDGSARRDYLPAQEKGTRASCPLPYELFVDGKLDSTGDELRITFAAGNSKFGKRASGSPFNAYAYLGLDRLQARAYAVEAGKQLSDAWSVHAFRDGRYHVRIDGPNGFMREFSGAHGEPYVDVSASYGDHDGLVLSVTNPTDEWLTIEVRDLAYGAKPVRFKIRAGKTEEIAVSTGPGKGWYDLDLRIQTVGKFSRRFAGRVESGRWGVTDPTMA